MPYAMPHASRGWFFRRTLVKTVLAGLGIARPILVKSIMVKPILVNLILVTRMPVKLIPVKLMLAGFGRATNACGG